jgi:hypothetical protein
MEMKIDYEEFNKLPFVDNIPDNKGFIYSSFLDESKGYLQHFHIDENNKFILSKSQGLIKGFYWSKKIIDPSSDTFINLIHLLGNKFSFYELINVIEGIGYDIHNFGAIIHKQFILWDYIKNKPNRSIMQELYITEIEYLMGIIRSYFDMIYEILITILSLSKDNLNELPESLGKFSERVLNRSKQRENDSFEYLKSSYKFNDSFAEFFSELMPFFKLCRNFRDSVYHRGKTPMLIFITENGPAVSLKENPSFYNPFYKFKPFLMTNKEVSKNLLDDDLVSLFYFINRLIDFTLKSSEKFANALEPSFILNNGGISENYLIFLRGPELKYINQIPNYLEQCWLR